VDESLVAIALVIKKGILFSLDFFLTGFVPGEVGLSILEFTFKEGSIVLGVLENLKVHVNHLGESGDGSASNFLICGVLNISNLLGFDVAFLQVIEESENSINSVVGFGADLK